MLHVTLGQNDRPLKCLVVVPRDLPSHAPLMIAYHGVGDTPDSMASYSQLDRLAAKHRFLLVYPDSDGKLWKVPRPDFPDNDKHRDLESFDALLQEMEQQYHIDSERVYVVGMSQGATFVHWLTSRRAEQIAAAVAHSGAPSSETDPSQGRTPILLIAGQADPVHDAMKSAAQQYQAAGIASEFMSVPELGHAWSAAHNEAMWDFLTETRR